MKVKYEVGIELNPNGDMITSKGLIGGRDVAEVRKHVKLNKSRNTYLHIKYGSNKEILEIWKLNKKEYQQLRCGFGLTDFGEFITKAWLM